MVGGDSNTASGADSCVVGGDGNTAATAYAVACGKDALTRNKAEIVQSSGSIATQGDAQVRHLVLHRQTTDATPLTLTDDGANDSIGFISLPYGSAASIRCHIVAQRDDETEMARYSFDALIKRNTSMAIAAVWNPGVNTDHEDDATWNCTFNGRNLTITGASGKTINWVAYVEVVESIV